MSKGNPVEEGNAEPATSRAGTEAAACVGVGNADDGSGLDEEIDEYDELLAALGRTEEEDQRIAVHEAGHAVCARLLGHSLGGATVDPDPNGKYGGLVWGPRHSVAFGKDDDADDVPEICDELRDLMPQDGEPRSDAADVYLHALNCCIELAAASVAERMLLEGEPVPSVSDVEHTIKYASLVCQSLEAAQRFIRLCETMADDLLRPYGYVLIALSTVLRIRRTLGGEEIDDVIATTVAGFELAAEQTRRRQWQQRIANAGRFKSEALQG
jgi:hypothetical protein